ncbi:MAG: response regulator [Candidatus Hinthialibacter antarcticus]|nr:response regulator [Candidatus Hinthialibacter antarcticus]
MIAERRLLVVDDEPIVCESCQRIFAGRGFQVDSSTDSSQGLQLAADNHYSAILLDLHMPGITGLEFLHQLRDRSIDSPVMLITGYPSVPTAAQSMRLGAADYIAKPFSPDEILSAVNRLFEEEPVENFPDQSPNTQASHPPVNEYRFVQNSWYTVDNTAYVSTGALVASRIGAEIQDIQLPQVGQMVYRGLPYASVHWSDGKQSLIASSLTGAVVAVNPAYISNPETLFERPIHEGWLAQVRPTQIEEDSKNSTQRNVVIVSSNGGMISEIGKRLQDYGSSVKAVNSTEAAKTLFNHQPLPLVIWDDSSFGEDGPSKLGEMLEQNPGLKAIVYNRDEQTLEFDYRHYPIFYYGIEPMEDSELIEALNSAFVAKPVTRVVRSSTPLPSTVSKIQITNRSNETNTLLSSGILLDRNTGFGAILIDQLLREGFPILVEYGEKYHSASTLTNEEKQCARLIHLNVEFGSGIHGSIRNNRFENGDKNSLAEEITIHANTGLSSAFNFGEASQALAEYLYQRLTASQKSAASN